DFESPTDSDHNNSYIVQVSASDGALSDTQTITVNIVDVATVIIGDNGNNTFISTPEDETFFGLGGIDTVVYSGLRSQYLVKTGVVDTLQVFDLRPGFSDDTDTLASIELLKFDDGGVSTDVARVNVLGNMPGWSALPGDFNGDGTSDLLWNNGAAGVLGAWLMKDGEIAGTMALNHNMPGWSSLVGDFNGDGTSDLLWNNGAPGVLGTWLMKDGQISEMIPVNHNMPGWSALVGDFNGDGTSDLLWNNGAAGVLAIWVMKNAQIGQTTALNHDMPGWSAVVGDFNGDGTSDLLWNNGAGVLGIWLMKNGQIAQTIALNHDMPGWSVAAIGDFNHDGTSDILWRNAAGLTSIWVMKDGQIAGTFGTGASAGWTPGAQGD